MKKKNFLKPAISLSLIIAMCLSGILAVPVSAAEYAGTIYAQDPAEWPPDYWTSRLQELYDSAVDAKNNQEIIKTGEAVLAYFLGTAYPEDIKKKTADFLEKKSAAINIISDVIMNVARAYETLRQNNGTVKAYKLAIPIIEVYGDFVSPVPGVKSAKTDETFRLNLIRNKILIYDFKTTVYAEVSGTGGDISFKNAKYEPRNGIIFGESYSDDKSRNSAGYSNASGSLFYVIFETESISSYNYILEPLSKEKDIIQIAWNLKDEGNSLANVLNQREKIEKEAEYLKSLGTPILLRFGAEMNVWSKTADPTQFIDAFRFVSKIMKEKAPNVAMVWSVNSINAKDKTYEMFYPGDEYVDWVGVSLYSLKYFKGNKNQDDNTQTIYLTGKYANPLLQLDPLIKLYGDKKPIMIAEGGAENYSVTNKTDETKWAEAQMRFMYRFLPMVYPQVKAVFYFNTSADDKSAYRFTLFENSAINKLYADLTSTNSYFIKKGQKTSDFSYKKLGTVTLPANAVTLNVYSPYVDRPNLVRTVRVNNKWLGTGDRFKLDLSSYSDGLHNITITVTDGAATLETVTIYAKKTGNSVTVSDKPLNK